MRHILLVMAVLCSIALVAPGAAAREGDPAPVITMPPPAGDVPVAQTIREIESRLTALERRIDQNSRRTTQAGLFSLMVLCGAFCALWAQNTGRNPWLWFVCGLLMTYLAVIAVLVWNADDRKPKAHSPPGPELGS